jgi:CRP-like cAMP-binding protein
VESGTASALKNSQKVFSYKENDFFGELALLKDIPRQATIVAEVSSIRIFGHSLE